MSEALPHLLDLHRWRSLPPSTEAWTDACFPRKGQLVHGYMSKAQPNTRTKLIGIFESRARDIKSHEESQVADSSDGVGAG